MLAFNRELLIGKGILYPSAGSNDNISREELAQFIRAAYSSNSASSLIKVNEILAELSREIDNYKPAIVILSSEIFQGINPSLFFSYFPASPLRVTLSQRRVDYFYESLVSQDAKVGILRTYPCFETSHYAEIIDPSHELNHWLKYLPIDNKTCAAFNKIHPFFRWKRQLTTLTYFKAKCSSFGWCNG